MCESCMWDLFVEEPNIDWNIMRLQPSIMKMCCNVRKTDLLFCSFPICKEIIWCYPLYPEENTSTELCMFIATLGNMIVLHERCLCSYRKYTITDALIYTVHNCTFIYLWQPALSTLLLHNIYTLLYSLS